jgi:hypothetical protein
MHKVNNINLQEGGSGESQSQSGNRNQNNKYSKSKIDPNDRSTLTYSDTLQTMDKVQAQLKGYERVDNIDSVEIGTPIRYITWKYGKLRFCIGGILIAINPTSCQLTNYRKDIQWNVKREHQKNPRDKKDIFKTIFYKKVRNLDKLNNNQSGGGDEIEIPKYTTLQSREIEKFYKVLNKKDDRNTWLSNNVYNKSYKQSFF